MSPPFWKTTWAYIVYFLATGLIVFTIFRYRMKQFQYKNRIAFEQKLREKQQKIHEERLDFFTNISHELRTPLTIIGIALEEMMPSVNNSPRLKKYYETAIKNSHRLKELINNLMEFRRVEKGVETLSVEQLELNAFLPEFLQDFQQMARHENVSLKLSLPLNKLSLWVDRDKFSMMLNNLLSNAFKNTPPNGQIVLSIDEDDKNIFVEVRDTGIGIRKKSLKKIFNRYYKLENKSTNTGIGLALTKSLVELHQGAIDVESKPNKGSRFTLKFLKGMNHFSPDQLLFSPENEVIHSKDEKWLDDERILLSDNHQIILLIEDNKEILDLLEDKFEDTYKIIKAHNGEEGVQLARKFSPDLIISDIMMPGISGIEVCKLLKNDSSTSHIPIVLLTAKGSEKDEIEGLDTGADDYISKPFKFSILKARANTILKNRKKIVDYFESKPAAQMDPAQIKTDKELAFLNMLKDYVIKNCLSENVSVFDIASNLGFSRTSLYRKVKSLTGMSINAFVRSVKIKKSAELITEGMNVSEAAYSVGFEDLKYFRDCFKKQIGMNPSDLK
jgi:DNA-binding response OmpR family regulator/anti-sigma regulatory factor (Ser/Thr protein kinase)